MKKTYLISKIIYLDPDAFEYIKFNAKYGRAQV